MALSRVLRGSVGKGDSQTGLRGHGEEVRTEGSDRSTLARFAILSQTLEVRVRTESEKGETTRSESPVLKE